jgi:CubicO group peptidase (beta-lactamase class C family)
MKPSRAFGTLLFAGVCFFASRTVAAAGSPAATAILPSGAALRAARQQLVDRVAKGEIPSVAVGLAHQDTVLWLEGLGQAGGAQPAASPRTLYPIASVSKSITGTVAAVLVAKGKLHWEDEVAQRLPGVARGVTLRQLVQHTSGLPHLWWYEYEAEPRSTLRREQILAAAGGTAFPPGTGFLYSNLNFEIVVQYIEACLGEPFEAVARRELWGPLGMEQTTANAWVGRDPVAAGYRAAARVPFEYRLAPRGGAGFFSSAGDLLRFARFHLGTLVGARRLLTSQALAESHGDDPQGSDHGYFNGWGRINLGAGDVALLSDGEVLGGTAAVFVLPRHQLAAVLLTNTSADLLETVFALVDAVEPGLAKRLGDAAQRLKAEWSRAGTMPVGAWKGSLTTDGTRLAVEIDFGAQPNPTLRLGDGPLRVLDEISWHRGLLEATVAGDFPLPTDRGRSHQLNLVLHPTATAIDGFAMDALAEDAAHRRFGVPSFLHLDRAAH